MSDFESATAVTPADESSYRADIHPDWSIGSVPNGGYLMAILARAALHSTGREDLVTISGNFMRPAAFGPADVRIEHLKAGRRVATVRASLVQSDVLVLDTTMTLGTLPVTGSQPEWSDHPPPSIPAPQDCITNDRGPFDVRLMEQVEQRIAPATLPFDKSDPMQLRRRPTGEPTIRAWLRLADGADPDPLFLALAVDALPPTVFNLDHFSWAPTVELTTLLRARPAPGWLIVESRTHLAVDGWFDEDATVWDSTGAVVAQARQLALIGKG